jgi:tRNA A-37 threonylcarbamoyl transferase component Bud32
MYVTMTRVLETVGLKDEQVLQLCKEAVGSSRIFASCFYGPGVYGYANERSYINVLLVVSDYTPKMRDFGRQLGGADFLILAVDKQLFGIDVAGEEFGGLIAEIVTMPYQPWKNAGYLKEMEVKIKKRLVVELLRDIVLKYPEMSTEILVRPEYFMYEVMRRKAKLFSPSIHSYSGILRGRAKEHNINLMMNGYSNALEELEAEKKVMLTDGYVRINKDFVETTKRHSSRLSNIRMSIQKALLPYIQDISKTTTVFLRNQRLFKKGASEKTEEEVVTQIEETERCILMPTPLGPVPLSDKTSIQDVVRKTVPEGEKLKIEIDEMGGVLNSVFLLRLQRDHEMQKIVVKKFEDWLGFKWFPLALWALGTQSFAVLGATRLEREYATNQILRKNGFNVPRILYVSHKERLIFEEFVEGEKTTETVKRIIASSPRRVAPNDAEIIKAVGKEVAKVHLLGIALGDCKPENILSMKNKVCFLDLEQATRNGNQPWDIAEFLYYSGHYILPIHSDEAARTIAFSFIDGYLEAGGRRENIRSVASAKYTKVFSIFTLPNIILTIASICRKMGTERS